MHSLSLTKQFLKVWHAANAAGTFLVNQLAFFAHSPGSEVLEGGLELLPLCANLWLLPTNSSSGGGDGSSLVRMLLLAAVSRVLLPLLAHHVQLRQSPAVSGISGGGGSSSRRTRLHNISVPSWC